MVYRIFGGVKPADESVAQKERRGNSSFEELDGNTNKLQLVDPTQDDGQRIIDGNPSVGRPLLPINIPTKLSREPWNLRLLPLLDMERYWGGNLLVPAAFKDLLEEMEPEVHQFWPMDIYVKGELVDRKYWFIACNRITAQSREHCYPPLDARGFWDPSPIGQRENDRLVFDSAVIGDRHAWVDTHYDDRMFSDAFAERLMVLNLSGTKFLHKAQV